MAKLNFRYGAMNCGKSDIMISEAYNYTEKGLDVVTAMPEGLMRKPGYTTSRAGKERKVDIATTDETHFYETYREHIGNRAIQCLLVDEATFMTPEQIDDLEKIAKIDNTSVIAYGLRSNIQRRLFPAAERLFALADSIEKMRTMCACGNQAEYNGRFVDNAFHVGEPIVWLDNDPDKVRYESMCGGCYLDNYASEDAIVV